MKVKANLTTKTLEYLDSKPYIQGEDSRNKLIVYVDANVSLTNIQIAYQLQNGRNTIKLINDGIIADDVDTENADYLEGYNGFVFNAPLSVTNVAGNFFATVIFTISTNVYKINVLNTVLKAVDFENFENALESEKADLIAFMNSTASSITIIEQDLKKILATTSTMANDVVQDLTALAAYPTDDLPDGFRVLVMNDSDYDDNPTLYQYNWDTNTWQYKGNFDWTQYLDAKFNGYKETLDDYVDERLDTQDQTIAGLGQLRPSGTDTSTNILAFTEDKGIYIGTDTGYWYYWNAAQTKYVSGGNYLASVADDELDANSTNSIQNKVVTKTFEKTKNIKYIDSSEKIDGSFISQYGTLVSGSPFYALLQNVELKKGETIYVKVNDDYLNNYSAISVISLFDPNTDYFAEVIKPCLENEHEYEYTATRNCLVSLTITSNIDNIVFYIYQKVNLINVNNANIDNNTITPLKLDEEFKPIYQDNDNVMDSNTIYHARLTSDGLLNYQEANDITSDFIYCKDKPIVYIWSAIYGDGIQALRIAFYDSNKEYISSVTWSTNATIPSNAYYVRVNFTNSSWVSYEPMVSFKNQCPAQYIPFGRKIKNFVEDDLGNFARIFKTIGIIGDSLSSGTVFKADGTFEMVYDNSWLTNLCIDTGATPTHYSTGGLDTKGWLLSNYKTQLENDTSKQLYIIALGTNDYSPSETYGLGDITDESGTDSFVGYYKEIIDVIHTKSPNSIIMCLSVYGNKNTTYQTPYSDMIKQISELYSYCFFIDFANNCPDEINLSISRIYTPYQENWHYTGLGYVAVGKTILKLLNEIINNNLNDFKFFVADFN